MHIAPGDEVYFETLNASNGQVTPESSAEDVCHVDFDNVNPVTGPVYVEGAEAGDALKISLLEFAPSGWGWSANIPDFGLLADDFPEPYMHHWHYPPDLTDAVPYEGSHARVPFKPMMGATGTALAAPGQHNILLPREAVETGIPPTKSPLEWAVSADGLLYTALIAIKPDGSLESGDITAQTVCTLDNLCQVVAAAGGTMADVNQVLIYLTDAGDAAAMNAVYRSYFDQPFPNRATVVNSVLLAPGAIIEIVAYAHIGQSGA